MSLINKKAAMFGLDARIALAIFGALSVISGASLYSAIQDAKAMALIVELKEVGKAWEQFYLDTGVNISRIDPNVGDAEYDILKSNELIADPGITGWNGPYLSYDAHTSYINYPQGLHIKLMMGKDADGWDESWNGGCKDDSYCNIYIMVNGITNESLVNKIDEIIDGGDGATSGDVRFFNGIYDWVIFLKNNIISNS